MFKDDDKWVENDALRMEYDFKTNIGTVMFPEDYDVINELGYINEDGVAIHFEDATNDNVMRIDIFMGSDQYAMLVRDDNGPWEVRRHVQDRI